MNNTLTQLWHGNLIPPRPVGSNDPEIADLEQLMQRNLNKLKDSLTPQQAELLTRYTDVVEEYEIVCDEFVFRTGFSMGARIITEALFNAEAAL